MRSLIALVILQTCCFALGEPKAQSMIGSWDVEITFSNGEKRSLRFEAEDAGRGSFVLSDPRSDMAGPSKPSGTKWVQSGENSVMFSGAVEFPIGNVGRAPGILVCKGKFENGNTIKGEASFFPPDQDPNNPKATPSKKGDFKATRVKGKQGSNGALAPELQLGSEATISAQVASVGVEQRLSSYRPFSLFLVSVTVNSIRVGET